MELYDLTSDPTESRNLIVNKIVTEAEAGAVNGTYILSEGSSKSGHRHAYTIPYKYRQVVQQLSGKVRQYISKYLALN